MKLQTTIELNESKYKNYESLTELNENINDNENIIGKMTKDSVTLESKLTEDFDYEETEDEEEKANKEIFDVVSEIYEEETNDSEVTANDEKQKQKKK